MLKEMRFSPPNPSLIILAEASFLGSTLILVENYDEEFSVHQRNRSQGNTLIALRHSLCIVDDRRMAYSAGQVLEGTSFKRGLIFH